jgi:predicted Zn-dependent peptidase
MHTVSCTRLRNGLRVVTVARPHLHQAVVAVTVRVGSRHERRRTNGLSHFLEHMLFRGTATRPSAAEFNHGIESLGATLTAATHGDYTLFELSVPPDALAQGCAALGEVFARPVFSDPAVEKGIVREEILEDLDEDGTDVNAENRSRALVFRGDGLGLPITGSTANVRRFTERDLRAHLAAHYVARNICVTVVGPLPHRAMARAVERAFGSLPAGAATPTAPFRVRQSRARIAVVPYAAAQTAVRVAFPTPGARAAQALAIELLLRVLDDGMSTRLHRRICDERGLAYEVHAGVELFEDVGVFEVGASVAHASLGSLVGEVFTILGDLALHGPTRAEVEKAHRRFAFDLDAMEDHPSALADFYGPAELFDRRQTPAARRVEALGVTASDIRRAARAVFDPSHLNLVLVGAEDPALRRAIAGLARRFRERIRACSRGRIDHPTTAPVIATSAPRPAVARGRPRAGGNRAAA